MPKKFLIFFIGLILLTFFFAPKEIEAYEEKDPVPNCLLTPTTSSAPGITDYIFKGEEFDLLAQYTDLTADHKFRASTLPYKVTVSYSRDPKTKLPGEDILGDMKLIRSVPNNDERDLSKEDTQECIERNHDGDCTKYAEDLDPGDQIDSWTTQSLNKLKFDKLPGIASINVYEQATKDPIYTNHLVCSKQVSVVDKASITVSVGQPLNPGDKVNITGLVWDHLNPVSNAKVTLTIGSKTVTTTSDSKGSYLYNSDTTSVWGLTTSNTSYTITASTSIGDQLYQGTANFGVGLVGPQTTGQLNTGVNPKVDLFRYTNGVDHWTTTSLEIPSPPNPPFYQEEGQGQLYTLDDGSGPLIPIYDCTSSAGHFLSLFNDTKCNANLQGNILGSTNNRLGYIYDPSLPEPTGTHPLYQCKNDTTGEEKTTLTSDCKNQPTDSTPYHLESTLGYVLDVTGKCPKLTYKNQDVTAPVDEDVLFSDKVSADNIYPPVNQSNETNPNLDDTPHIGISYNNFISSFFGKIVCSVTDLFGGSSFCPQNLSLSQKGTNYLLNKTNTLHGSLVYQNIQRSPQPYNSAAIYDDTQKASNDTCNNGNQVVNTLTDKLGKDASLYSVEFPNQITTDSTNNSTQQLKNTNPDQKLEWGTNPLESERVGQYQPNRCLYFQGTFANNLIPQGFNCPQPSPTPTPQS